MNDHRPDTADTPIDRAASWSAETLAGASPALSGIASLGPMLVMAAFAVSALPNSASADEGITPVRPGTQQAATLNSPRGPDRPAPSQHSANFTLPDPANAPSMAMEPGTTEVPTFYVREVPRTEGWPPVSGTLSPQCRRWPKPPLRLLADPSPCQQGEAARGPGQAPGGDGPDRSCLGARLRHLAWSARRSHSCAT